MKVKKSWILQGVIFILFAIFLFSLIPKPQEADEEKVIEYGQNSKETLNVKFSIVSQSIGEELENSKIGSINNKYLSELIVNKKISNRENTIAQELITMHKKNLINESLMLSLEIIEPILNQFDSKKERKWFNYEFSFLGENESFIFYEQKYLLRDFNESDVTGEYVFKARPYLFERYEFTMENGSIEIVDVNLLDSQGEDKLSEFIDINTYQPRKSFKNLNSYFIESDEEYIFTIRIWS